MQSRSEVSNLPTLNSGGRNIQETVFEQLEKASRVTRESTQADKGLRSDAVNNNHGCDHDWVVSSSIDEDSEDKSRAHEGWADEGS